MTEPMIRPSARLPDLAMPVRAAMDLVVLRAGQTRDGIHGQLLGQERLIAELERYAPVIEDAALVIALAADPAEVRAVVVSSSPARVITVVDGPLARSIRRRRTQPLALAADLTPATWQTLGYERVMSDGIQGIASLCWLVAERLARRFGQPDLADRGRIAMLRTLRTVESRRSLASILVREYRRKS